MNNERFTFQTLGDLRDWLNQFAESDPDPTTIYPANGDNIVVDLHYRKLSDGSEVTDVSFAID